MTRLVVPRRDVLVQHDVEAPMRDGVVLRANVDRPADDGRYPVLLSRQPYNKDLNINPMYADPVRLAAHGYIVVMQDVRGRYAFEAMAKPPDAPLYQRPWPDDLYERLSVSNHALITLADALRQPVPRSDQVAAVVRR